MENKTMICIECPRGCDLQAAPTENGWIITGYRCLRGKKYAECELTEPRRILTTTVRALHGRIPVKTRGEVKKEKMLLLMKKIRTIEIDREIQIGDVIATNIDGEGTDLIATENYDPGKDDFRKI